jgi:threonine synthase
MQMGLPVGKLICASNKNNVLTDFFTTGKYDINREFYKTTSPSMDILISSNLERLAFEISGRDSTLTATRMKDLVEKGEYKVTKEEKAKLDNLFYAGYCTEEETVETISTYFDELSYTVDPHTAVGLKVSNDFKEKFGDESKVVCLSTASPYKFPTDVLKAINGKVVDDPFKASEALFEESAMLIPENLTKLVTAKVRFNTTVERNELLQEVLKFLED